VLLVGEEEDEGGDGDGNAGRQHRDEFNARMTRLRSYVLFGRGRVADTLDADVVTHVAVVGSGGARTMARMDDMAARVAGAGGAAKVVLGSWVEMCWREGALVDEEDFV
jgi:hypothetical protein